MSIVITQSFMEYVLPLFCGEILDFSHYRGETAIGFAVIHHKLHREPLRLEKQLPYNGT